MPGFFYKDEYYLGRTLLTTSRKVYKLPRCTTELPLLIVSTLSQIKGNTNVGCRYIL